MRTYSNLIRLLFFATVALALMLWRPTPKHELPPDTPWHALLDVSYANSLTPVFSDSTRQLDGEQIRITGFMYPLEGKRSQHHFLLSAYPPTCNFCLPGGPEALVEVRSQEPVPYSYDLVLLSGQFALKENSDSGVYYHLTNARLEDAP